MEKIKEMLEKQMTLLSELSKIARNNGDVTALCNLSEEMWRGTQACKLLLTVESFNNKRD